MARMATTIWLAVCLIGSGGCGMKGNQQSSGQSDSTLPNPYRPDRSNDPHARKTWEDGVTALEAECRQSGRYCEDAKSSRAALRKGQP